MSTRSLRSTVAGARAAVAPHASASGSLSVGRAVQDKVGDKSKNGASVPKKRKKANVKGPSTELAPLELFLAMPLDIFAAICAHLTTNDLLNLSLTAKVFRKPLVADTGRSIWRAQRRAAELAIFKGMSEIAFANLIYGKGCFRCDTTKRAELNLDFRSRLCLMCRKSMFVCKSRLRSVMPDLHAQAAECVISTHYSPIDSAENFLGAEQWLYGQCYLLRMDLEKVNEELMPLQDDDDVMEDVRLAAKLRRGTKSRRNTEVDTIDDTPKVVTFVAGKVAHIQTVAEKTKMVRGALLETKLRKREREVEERRALHARRTARYNDIVARVKSFMLAKGWDEAKFDGALKWSDFDVCYDDEVRVLEDAEWTSLQPAIIALIEDGHVQFLSYSARQALLVAQEAHKIALTTRFNVLRDAASATRKLTFFTTSAFLKLPEITTLWTNANSVIDDATWASVLPGVEAAISSRRHNLRGEAVRAILASKGFSADRIDIEVRENLDSYTSAYFQRVTSLFRDDHGHLRAYPAILDNLGRRKLSECKSKLSTRILRKIVEASGMGKKATVAQLDSRAPVMCFAEDSTSGRRYAWRQIYRAIYDKFKGKDKDARRSAAMTISLAPPVAAAS